MMRLAGDSIDAETLRGRRRSGAASPAAHGSMGREACPGCGRAYPEVDGILHAIGPLDRDEPDRRGVLRRPGLAPVPALGAALPLVPGAGPRPRRGGRSSGTCPGWPTARVLEVGIGDGENLPLLAAGLGRLRRRHRADANSAPAATGSRRWRAGWPGPRARRCRSPTRSFDAVYTVGGFNYFRDPAAALREMRRVARPGGAVIVGRRDPRPLPVRDRARARARRDRPLVAPADGPRRRIRRDGPGYHRVDVEAGRASGLAAASPRSRSGTGWATVWSIPDSMSEVRT